MADIEVTYVFGASAKYTGKVTRRRYKFLAGQWTPVDELDWPDMERRQATVGGCCSKPHQTHRCFGTKGEVEAGLVPLRV